MVLHDVSMNIAPNLLIHKCPLAKCGKPYFDIIICEIDNYHKNATIQIYRRIPPLKYFQMIHVFNNSYIYLSQLYSMSKNQLITNTWLSGWTTKTLSKLCITDPYTVNEISSYNFKTKGLIAKTTIIQFMLQRNATVIKSHIMTLSYESHIS